MRSDHRLSPRQTRIRAMRLSSRPQTRMGQSYAGSDPKSGKSLPDGRPRPVVFGEAAQRGVEAGVERFLQRLRGQARRLLAVVGQGDQPRDQRPRVRSAERRLSVQVVEQISDLLLVERDALALSLV